MTRRSAIEASVRDIERHAAAERRQRDAEARAAEREAEHEREDRELQRARLRALVNTRDPGRRERIDDAYDLARAELARERNTGPRPAGDLDAGKGVNTDPPPVSRGHWSNALSILDER